MKISTRTVDYLVFDLLFNGSNWSFAKLTTNFHTLVFSYSKLINSDFAYFWCGMWVEVVNAQFVQVHHLLKSSIQVAFEFFSFSAFVRSLEASS